MKIKCMVLFFIFLTNVSLSQGKYYYNYTLYDVFPTERFQLEFLQNLEAMKYVDAIFWRRPHKMYTNIQVLVNPRDKALFEERLNHFSMERTILSNDIQSLFNSQQLQKYSRTITETYKWETYHTLEDVYQWMSDIAMKYSERVNLRNVGISAEGREILALEISNPGAKAKAMVVGALHGNEWITTEFVTYLAHQLIVADTSHNGRLKQVAKKFFWFIVPVVNPDGYDYSMKHDRLWTKNRRRFGNGKFGVDLNKNFDYNFCSHGGSNSTDSAYYCGPGPFSEPETQALAQYLDQNKARLTYYLDFHAYGQYIVIPYSDRIKHIENFSEMENYGKQAILKMYKIRGDKYRAGTNYDVFGLRESGDSISWAKKTHNIRYALSIYMRDNGTFGHALPSDEIMPTCQETMVGLLELMTARHKPLGFDLNAALIIRSNLVQGLLFLMLFWFE